MQNKTEIELKASHGLSIKSRIDRLTEELANLSEFFRDEAGGETFTFELKGEGKITVSKPSEGSRSTVISLNMAKLTEAHKNYLIEAGVLTEEVKVSQGRKAAVSYKPNV